MERKSSIFILLLFFLFTYSLAPAQSDDLPRTSTDSYRLYGIKEQREVSIEELLAACKTADVVFFGEEHNDSVAHRLQLDILRGMHRLYGNVTLSLEMFVSDDQLILNEYLKNLITERNFSREAGIWSNYKDYKPMVEYSKEYQLDVIAANAPSRYTNRVTRLGLESLYELDQESRELLAPLPVDTLTGRYYDKFAALLGGHANMVNSNIYQSQNLWDATMAFRISEYARKKPGSKILHLNGRFHSDERLGTVAQLARYAPALKTLIISCFSDDSFSQPTWERFAGLGDYIIVTDPTLPRSY